MALPSATRDRNTADMKEASTAQSALSEKLLSSRVRQRKKPVQHRSAHTIELLLDATIQVLREHGYARLTTTRVAQRAGASVGTVYQYFPDKRSLVAAVKVRYLEQLVAHVRQVANGLHQQSLEKTIKGMMAGLIAFKRETLSTSLALREPMAELSHNDLAQEAAAQLTEVTAALLMSAWPTLGNALHLAAIVNAAVEGVIAAAIHASPANPFTGQLEQDLTILALAYLRAAAQESAVQ
jgi:AcrR family transcriptional regulator